MKVSLLLYWFCKQSKRVLFLSFFSFIIIFFLKNRGLNFMKRLINKAFLTPSVEQLLRRQADCWTSKTIHLLRENFDFECTNIIKHQFVFKSKKKKEFTVPWAQHFLSKQSSSRRYYFNREGEALMGSLFDAILHRGRILLYLKFISMEEAFLAHPPHRPLPTVWLCVLGFFFLNFLPSKIIIHLFLFQLFIDYLLFSFFKIRK